jgi:hypothetical protein
MKNEHFKNRLELAAALHGLGGSGIRLIDVMDVEYLVPLKRLAVVLPQDAFVVAARDGAPWPLTSLAYPIRVSVSDAVSANGDLTGARVARCPTPSRQRQLWGGDNVGDGCTQT